MPAIAPFDVTSPLRALADLGRSCSGVVTEQHIGVPQSYSTRGSVFIAVSNFEVRRVAANGPRGGVIERWQWYLVGFGYRVESASAEAAELALADFVNRFTQEVYRDPTLTGLGEDILLDSSLNVQPQYDDVIKDEIRLYQLRIGIKQRTVL